MRTVEEIVNRLEGLVNSKRQIEKEISTIKEEQSKRFLISELKQVEAKITVLNWVLEK